MAWIADLAPCTYFPMGHDCLRAVGWLGEGRPFATGAVSSEVLGRLRELLRDPWQLCDFRGAHLCKFCRREYGISNLFVPAKGFVFAAPGMIGHYIEQHQYRPPEEFLSAVLACPPMRSEEYFDAVRGHTPSIAHYVYGRETHWRLHLEFMERLEHERQARLDRREVMIGYRSGNRTPWVTEYRPGKGFLKIRFHNQSVRLYTDDLTGFDRVMAMKRMARKGEGLEEYLRQERPRWTPDLTIDADEAKKTFGDINH